MVNTQAFSNTTPVDSRNRTAGGSMVTILDKISEDQDTDRNDSVFVKQQTLLMKGCDLNM